jgi:MiaB-like tRNA modifying enzyme
LVRVYVEVYGCSANRADAEIASGLLLEAGHEIVDGAKDADVSVLLTCIVKTPTERKVVRRLKELEGKRVVVAGCMPKAQRSVVEEVSPGASLVGPDDVERIPEAVSAAAAGDKIVCLGGTSPDRTCLPRMRFSGVVHIAPIAAGCLGNCSYCIVKVARGRLRSFPAEGIVRDAEEAIASGCKEIWVTAEDTAAYDYNGVRLPDLLRSLGEIDGDFMIRVGMMTPNSALPIVDDLVDAFRGEKVFRFLHAPVQAGSDEVLARMRRKYNVTDFKDLVTRFRDGVPGLGVSTDIICGFPGESEDQFRESLSLIEWLHPDALNMNRFWPRPGTEAAELSGQLNGRITKDRSRRLNELWTRVGQEANESWLGWVGDVLLDEVGHSGAKMGRTRSYKAVTVVTGARLGEWIRVRVTGAERAYLLGEDVTDGSD